MITTGTVIEVTAEDIDAAIRGDSTGTLDHSQSCPIARAAQRLTDQRVDVGNVSLTIDGWSESAESFILPIEAAYFVSNFDSNVLSVKPFSFVVGEPWK